VLEEEDHEDEDVFRQLSDIFNTNIVEVDSIEIEDNPPEKVVLTKDQMDDRATKKLGDY